MFPDGHAITKARGVQKRGRERSGGRKDREDTRELRPPVPDDYDFAPDAPTVVCDSIDTPV